MTCLSGSILEQVDRREVLMRALGRCVTLPLLAVVLATACGKSGGSGGGASLGVSPTVQAVTAGDPAVTFTATLTGAADPIHWMLTPPGVGTISPETGLSTSYTPPATSARTTAVTLTAKAGALTASAAITVAPESVHQLVLVDHNGDVISVVDESASGLTVPARSFGSLTGLRGPGGVAVDAIRGELIVANRWSRGDDTLRVFSRTASGNAAPVRTVSIGYGVEGVFLDLANEEIVLAGSAGVAVIGRADSGTVRPRRQIQGASSGLAAPRAVAVAPGRDEIFTCNESSITVHPRLADGNAAPTRTIAGSATGLSSPGSIALDTTHAEIFAANYTGTVTVYGIEEGGNVPPRRTITGLAKVTGVAVDAAHDEVVVATGDGTLLVFARTASGAAPPLRTVSGVAAGLKVLSQPVVDAASDEIVFTEVRGNAVFVFDRTASGEVAPKRRISAEGTGLLYPWAVAVDKAHGEVFVTNLEGRSVTVYPATARGDVTPLRRIAGTQAGFVSPGAIALDPAHDEILVGDGPAVRVFPRMADGNVSPVRTLAGPATGLVWLSGVAVDPVGDVLFALDSQAEVVAVFPRTADGDVAPLRTIRGGKTGLSTPQSLFHDATHGELLVGNAPSYLFERSVIVFGAGESGDVAPRRSIAGSATPYLGLYPNGIAVDVRSDELFVGGDDRGMRGVLVFRRTDSGSVLPVRSIGSGDLPAGLALLP
jgi:hypothetical protein